MPLSFYIVSHPSTKVIVENEDFVAIDKFIENPTPFRGPMDDWCFKGFICELNPGYEWIDSVYQIASRAVELDKPNVIRHVADRIRFDYTRDGNSYTLFLLAVEKGHFHLISLLWDIAIENRMYPKAVEQLEYAVERVFYGDAVYGDDEDTVLAGLQYFCDKDISLYAFYQRCVGLQKNKIVAYLEENCSDKILGQSVPEPTNDTTEVSCKHGLKVSDYAGNDYVGGYICDQCDAREQGSRWHCAMCGLDVCPNCRALPTTTETPSI